MFFLKIIIKIYRYFSIRLLIFASYLYSRLIFRIEGVIYGEKFIVHGFPKLVIAKSNSNLKIGNNCVINSGNSFNLIGRQQRTMFILADNSILEIGNNTGLSSTVIVCHKHVRIGDNVKIGGNVVIYDTDFHSLNSNERNAIPEVKNNIRVKEVIINDNVFIGAHTTILKGSVIGENSIIGSGSVVSAIIPPNEVWAGNPAKFIKKAP